MLVSIEKANQYQGLFNLLQSQYGVTATIDDMNEIINESQKVNSLHPISFARWLLKYADEGWDNGLLCWKFNGNFYDTDQIYEVYRSMQ